MKFTWKNGDIHYRKDGDVDYKTKKRRRVSSYKSNSKMFIVQLKLKNIFKTKYEQINNIIKNLKKDEKYQYEVQREWGISV